MLSEQEHKNLKGKLNAISGVLRLGHEAFEKENIEALALHIVNNSRLLSDYGRSSLLEFRGNSTRVLAISGQILPSQNSEFSTALKKLASALKSLSSPLRLKNESFAKPDAPGEGEAPFRTMSDARPEHEILILPLLPPGGRHSEANFFWIVEYFSGLQQSDENLLSLLAQHYAEAIHFHAQDRNSVHENGLLSWWRAKDRKKKALWIAGALLVILFGIRVRQYAVADFELASDSQSICYSSIDGTLKSALRTKGDSVGKGEPVIEFDTDELSFKLASAQKDYELSSAELELAEQKSFSSAELIGKAKLLALKKEQTRIEIEKNKWLLSQCVLKAPQNGILVMDDREKLKGRSVKAGEKLFDVISPEYLIAEVRLSERDASVLGEGMSISLYLHTLPEYSLRGTLISVSPKPVLTDDRLFCYILRVKLEKPPQNLICGMRGVARVGGGRVSLAYYLFRSAVLWWRKI